MSTARADVMRQFWHDRKIRAMHEDGRTLALYLLTCPSGSLEGFFHLEAALPSTHLGWDEDRVTYAFVALSTYGFAYYDDEAEVVFICKALKYHAPKGAKSTTAAIKVLEAVQGSPALFLDFLRAADKYAPEFARAIRTRYPKVAAEDGKRNPTVARSEAMRNPTVARSESHGSSPCAGPNPTPDIPTADGASEFGRTSSSSSSLHSSEVLRLSNLLAELITARDEKARVDPESKLWLDSIRLLIERDGRPPADVEHVIRWCQRDPFWQQNILSARKLRDKFTQLWAKAGKTSRATAANFNQEAGIQ